MQSGISGNFCQNAKAKFAFCTYQWQLQLAFCRISGQDDALPFSHSNLWKPCILSVGEQQAEYWLTINNLQHMLRHLCSVTVSLLAHNFHWTSLPFLNGGLWDPCWVGLGVTSGHGSKTRCSWKVEHPRIIGCVTKRFTKDWSGRFLIATTRACWNSQKRDELHSGSQIVE